MRFAKFKGRKVVTFFTAFLLIPLHFTLLSLYAQIPLEPNLGKSLLGPEVVIPPRFGTIEEYSPPEAGSRIPAPFVIHIQSVHGNYQAEKNTARLLHYLQKSYGTNLLLLEGGVGKLEPGLFNLFPARPELNIRVADSLLKRAELSGAELFLIETLGKAESEAYGIEDTEAYRKNRLAFQKVLREKEKTDAFLRSLDSQARHLVNSQLKPSVRRFLREFEAYERSERDEIAFLAFLKKEAKQELEIDLDQASHQADWPMLVRFLRLQTLERKLDRSLAEREKDQFLSKLEKFAVSPELLARIRGIVEKPGNFHPGTRPAFEELLEALPSNFDFKEFSHLKVLIQSVVLQSELEGKRLFGEIDNLAERIAEVLAATEEEKKLLPLLREVRLLEKLFRLELKREEFEAILAKGKENLLPSTVWRRLFETNGSKGRPVDAGSFKDMDRLFGLAVSFYEGAIGREHFMRENISSLLSRTGSKPVVLVTGGFHAEGLKESLRGQGLSYVRVTPRMNGLPQADSYHRAMLEKNKTASQVSQIANLLKIQPLDRLIAQANFNPRYVRYLAGQLAQAFREAGFEAASLASHDPELFARQYHIRIRVTGTDGNVLPLVRIAFLPSHSFSQKYSRRSEARSPKEALNEIRTRVGRDPSEANEVNLKFVLETLKEAVEKPDRAVRQRALGILSIFFAEAPSLRSVASSYRNVILQAFENELRLTKAVKEAEKSRRKILFHELMPLEIALHGEKPEEVFRASPTATLESLADWIFQHRTSSPSDILEISVPYDTGMFPSQFERGKFVALLLHLTNLALTQFWTVGKIDPAKGEKTILRRFSDTQGNIRLNYFFRLSSGIEETEETLQAENFIPYLYKVLKGAQRMTEGLIMASEQERYQEIFPGENPPGWGEREVALAQAFRALQRRSIRFLRDYDPLRDPNRIDPLRGPQERLPQLAELHREMQMAFEDFLLEEVFYPEQHPWFYWYYDSPPNENAWNKRILPRLRAAEGMALQNEPGKKHMVGKLEYGKKVGFEYVEGLQALVEEYVAAVDAILSTKSFTLAKVNKIFASAEISTGFSEAFKEAGKLYDPFIDTKVHKQATVHYLRQALQALEERRILPAHFPEPAKVTPEAITNIINFLSPPRRPSSEDTQTGPPTVRGESRGARRVTEILMDGIHGLEVRTSESGKKRAESRIEDSRFAVVSVPVPEGISLRDLRRTLRESKFRQFLSRYPKRLLLLTFSGGVPEAVAERIYRESGERVFLFGGEHRKITESLFVSPGDYSKLGEVNRRLASRLLPQASKLKGGEPLKSLELGKFALVVARKEFLEELPRRISKEFREVPLTGLSPEELLQAYLHFGIPIASLPYGDFKNAPLRERYPELFFEMDDFTQSLVVTFRSDALARIRAAVRANRFASRSA